jgi:hypothetical protein
MPRTRREFSLRRVLVFLRTGARNNFVEAGKGPMDDDAK